MEIKVYKGKFVQVTEEDIEGAIYERVYVNNSVTIFPFDEKGKLIFIKEKRVHEIPQIRWKPITGFYEDHMDLLENTNREMQEEIGKKAGVIKPFFEIRQSGTFNITQYFTLAWDLSESRIPNPDGDVILEVASLDLEEVLERTLTGELSLGAGGYALLRLYHEIKQGKWDIPGL